MNSFSIGQKAFIARNGKVLLLKRSGNVDRPDFWDFPGGRVEWGESLKDALSREVKEEVSLHLTKVIKPLSMTSFINSADSKNQLIRIIYLCSASGDASLSKEHKDFKWVDPANHTLYKFLADDYHQAFERFLGKEEQNNDDFIFDELLK